ncbi:hypothetical protein JTE78_24705 [Pseudomonas syringae pv. aptata]|uniref:hypothetical protein n=1 Tax=Pseudomonas syringae TaxID=317 RepID=UPI00203C091E|nr:hypothetical protein [Pseudomonas syringae]MCK0545852.1 hypothetical protein [Pseudomonas syringae pv. aptata]
MRLIIETTCRRILAREPGSHEAMIQHLKTFGALNCLSPEQVSEFTNPPPSFGLIMPHGMQEKALRIML